MKTFSLTVYRGEDQICGWSAVGGQSQSAYVRGGLREDDTPGGHSVRRSTKLHDTLRLTKGNIRTLEALRLVQQSASARASLRSRSDPKHQDLLSPQDLGLLSTRSSRRLDLYLKMALFLSHYSVIQLGQ